MKAILQCIYLYIFISPNHGSSSMKYCRIYLAVSIRPTMRHIRVEIDNLHLCKPKLKVFQKCEHSAYCCSCYTASTIVLYGNCSHKPTILGYKQNVNYSSKVSTECLREFYDCATCRPDRYSLSYFPFTLRFSVDRCS